MAAAAAKGQGMDRQVPERVGKYELERELGKGSSGRVFLARDPFNDRDVAIKLYFTGDQVKGNQARLQDSLFFNEARLAGQLKHPNILPIHDAGEEDGLRYVVMDYLPNSQPLSDFCKSGKLLPLEKVVEVFFSTAKALDHAHRHGVVHRDIKPANILMNRNGHTLIVDFGIAKSSRGEQPDLPGAIGTPRYMSPEQVRGQREIGNESDIYSLGVTIYELLTGMCPFYGQTLKLLTEKILNENPVPVNQYRVECPEILTRVLMRCLRKDPRKRYRSALDVAGDLAYIFDHIDEQRAEIDAGERFAMMRALKFFDDFTDAEVREVMEAGQWRQFASGKNIITEGELDDAFFVVVDGEVTVWKGETELGILGCGDVFGEMGFARRIKRTATIRARGSVHLLCLNATAMQKASKDAQLKFHQVFVHTLIDRLATANERLLAASI